MLRELKSLPSFPMLASRLSRIARFRLGLGKLEYRPYFRSFELFCKYLHETGREEKIVSDFRNRLSGFPYSLEIPLPILKREYQQDFANVIEEAEDLLKGRYRIFERTLLFQNEPEWHRSEHGEEWPRKHISELDIRPKVLGDIKYTWELNKLNYLQTLSIAYYLTLDKNYFNKIILDIESWIESNPPEYGVNWMYDLIIAHRLFSLTVVLQIVGRHIPNQLVKKIMWVFLESGRHIAKEISFTQKCIPNNHVIGAAFGLLLSGWACQGFRNEAAKWVTRGKGYLVRAIDDLFFEDGSYKNMSTNYQRISSEFILSSVMLLDKLGDKEASLKLATLLGKSITFLESISVDEHLPPIGAWDSAHLFHQYTIEDDTNTKYLFSMVNRCLYGEEHKSLQSAFVEKRSIVAKVTPAESSTICASNGINKVSRDNIEAFLITGTHPLYSQRHSDFLGVLIYYNGRELLGDSGNYRYNTELQINHYFRSSLSHNCLVVDGKSTAEPYSLFRWLNYPKSEVKCCDDLILKGRIAQDTFLHERELSILSGNEIKIVDKLYIKDYRNMFNKQVELWFHFAECGKLIRCDHSIIELEYVNRMRFRIELDNRLDLFFYSGSEQPFSGWKSSSYGEIHKTLSLKAYRILKKEDLEFETRIEICDS